MTGLRIAALLLGITVGLGVMATSGRVTADSPAPVPPHRHYKLLASGEKVYVGPRFCDNIAASQGFYRFHQRVHLTDPGINDIKSESC
jgi:hypothetical protein